jgi:hypothetical protein
MRKEELTMRSTYGLGAEEHEWVDGLPASEGAKVEIANYLSRKNARHGEVLYQQMRDCERQVAHKQAIIDKFRRFLEEE